MPYIKKIDRERFATFIDSFVKVDVKSTGEFNYVLTSLVLAYARRTNMSYANLSAICGVIDDVKHEFRRRIVDAYENKKAVENGDVY